LLVLSAVAVRLGRRIGLHRDGTSLELSPFETEMRRRLWWQIVHIDFRASDFSGTKPSMDLFLSDTKAPLNVEDEDLSPDMVELPPERTGITSAVLCLIRCDVMDFLRKITPQFSSDVHWDRLYNSNMTLAEKDNVITHIQDVLERKYLRYCDPSNSLHYFVSIIARSSICKMKLTAHNPRQFANCGVKVPSKERDIIFANGMKLLEYGILIQTSPQLSKFIPHISTASMWNTLLYVLIETRHRKTGPEVNRVWQIIGDVFSNYPEVFTEPTNALYAALGKWTLLVWEECAAASKAEGHPEIPTPEYIITLCRARSRLTESSSKPHGSIDPGTVLRNSTDYSKGNSLGLDGNWVTDFESSDSYDFSNLLSFDLEPGEWAQWERLLGGQGF
jgi:hypothetical protein